MKKIIIYFLLVSIYFNSTINAQVLNKSIIDKVDIENGYYYFNQEKNLTLNDFLNNKSILGLSELDGFIEYNHEKDNIGYIRNRYFQSYNGVKIEKSMFIVTSNSKGKLLYGKGFIVKNLNLSTTPAIRPEEAISTAIKEVNAKVYIWESSKYEKSIKKETNKPDATYYPKAQLVIAKTDLTLDNNQNNFKLCYSIPVISLIPQESYTVYIDALTGTLIRKEDGNNYEPVSKSNLGKTEETLLKEKADFFYNEKKDESNNQETNSQKNIQSCDGSCIQGDANLLYGYGSQNIWTSEATHLLLCDYHLKNTCNAYLYVVQMSSSFEVEYWDGTNNWTDNGDKEGTTTLWCLQQAYDFFRLTPFYSRNSYDGNGSQVKVITNSIETYWDRTNDNIKVNSGEEGLDVIAHEYTHGIIHTSMGGSGLGNSGEEGALNESFGDIFGTMVEFYTMTGDYMFGEDVYPFTCGLQRSLSNPKELCEPDTYLGTNWYTVTNCSPNSSNDNCGIHTNCGVMDYWFYLLSEGGSFYIDDNPYNPEYCVQKIGRDKAAQICYLNMTTLSSGATYTNARAGSIQAAIDLFGANSNEVAQVTNAWFAVGVGAAYNGIVEINNHTVSGSETINNNNELVYNNLQVPSGNSLTTSSSNMIRFKPTSTISYGSNLHAYITTGCFSTNKSANYFVVYDNDSQNNNNLPLKEKKDSLSTVTANKLNFTFTPNPSNGVFSIFKQNDINNSNWQVNITSLIGKDIYNSSFDANEASINLSSFPKGIYIVKINCENKLFTEKIVVQ